MGSLFKKMEIPLVLGIILLAVFLGLSQTIYYLFHTPAASIFTFAHNHLEDYFYYLHIMRQGWEGAWGATSFLTPEVYSRKVVVVFFLILGHFSRISGVSLPVMYTLSRAMGGLILFVLIYVLSFFVYPQSAGKRLISLLLALLSTGFWSLKNSTVSIAPLVHSWTELDPLFRISYIPHHLWSKIFMLVAFILILKEGKKGIFHTVLIVSAVLFMGFSSPVTLATFVPIIIIWFLWEMRIQKAGKVKINVINFIIVISVSLLIALYHRYIQHGVFPWNSYVQWERVQYPISFYDYFLALGPTVIFFGISLPWLYRLGKIGTLMISWVLTAFVTLFAVGKILPLSNIRFLEGYQFIPLAIGATEGLWLTARFLSGKIVKTCRQTLFSEGSAAWQPQKHPQGNPVFGAPRLASPILYSIYNIFASKSKHEKFLLTVFISVVFVYFFVGVKGSWDEHVGYVRQNMGDARVYMPFELNLAIEAVSGKTPPGSVVLAPYEISNMIPVMTGRRVLAGHPMMTYQYGKKREDMERFFSLREPEFMKKLLTEYKIQAILSLGEIPKEIKDKLKFKLLYQNSRYSLYSRVD